jgi:hypothetical protein
MKVMLHDSQLVYKQVVKCEKVCVPNIVANKFILGRLLEYTKKNKNKNKKYKVHSISFS